MANKKLDFGELIELVFNQNQSSKQNKDRLFKLAKSNKDLNTIKKLANDLQFKNAILHLDKIDKLSLNDAIKNKDINLLKNLIDKETDLSKINIADLYKNNYSFEFIKILIEYGARLNSKTIIFVPSFGTSLHVSILNITIIKKNIDFFKFLLTQNDSIDNFELNNKFTSLMIAIWCDNFKIVEILINKGVDIEAKDINGVTPLIRASCQGYKDIVEVLLKNGANVHSKDNNNGTAIEDAYFMKHFNIVDLLLKYGATMSDLDKFRHSNIGKEKEKLISECVQKILKTIKSDYIAKQFVLEELESAKESKTKESLDWVTLSGYKNEEFENAMSNSLPEVDGPYGPQQTLSRLQVEYFGRDYIISSRYRREIVDRIIKKYSLGKYKNIEKQLILENQDVITISNDKNFIEYKNEKFNKIYDKKYFNRKLKQYIELTDNKVVIYEADYNNKKSKNYINIVYERELTPEIILEDAIKYKSIRLLKKAFDKGINAKEHNIMLFILENYDNEFIKLLINNNAKLDIRSEYGSSALMAAIDFDKIEIAKLLIQKGVDCSIQATDMGKESQTALTLACSKNDLETNNYIDIIKLIINKHKKINSYEASCVERLIFNPTLAKFLSSLLVEDNDCTYTMLMYVINLQGSFLLNSFDSIWEITVDKSDSLENDKNEYLNKILLVCDNLIKGGVDLNFKSKGKTALSIAKELCLEEVINLIKNYQTINLNKVGFIKFGNYMINLTGDKTLLININNVDKVRKLNKISQNKFQDDNNNTFLISNEIVILQDSLGEKNEYIVESLEGKILDINETHDPKALADLLKKFSNDKRLKYTNHPWTDITYKDFYENIKSGWNDIKDDLEMLSTILFKQINGFLLNEDDTSIGFSSKPIKDQLKSGNIKPDAIEELNESIDKFKQSISIKNDENQKLIELFERVLDKCQLDLDIDLESIEDFSTKFFTDVIKLEDALVLILKDINKMDSNAEIRVIADSALDLITLKIIHKESTYNDDSSVLLNTISETGNFKSIYDLLKYVCHWGIETECTDGVQKIHYLCPQTDSLSPYLDPSNTNVEGFTHVLRFYK